MPRGRWAPRRGQVFDSRDSLEERLLESGWEFEGHSTELEDGKAIGYNIGVEDKKETVWLWIDMEPIVRVTRVKRIPLPYKGG